LPAEVAQPEQVADEAPPAAISNEPSGIGLQFPDSSSSGKTPRMRRPRMNFALTRMIATNSRGSVNSIASAATR
jgi:hypothetical protein